MSTYRSFQPILTGITRTVLLIPMMFGLCIPVQANESRAVEPSAPHSANAKDLKQIADWLSFHENTELKNDLSMRGYVAQTIGTFGEQTDTDQALVPEFQFVFYPRFQCSPLIKLVVELPDQLSSQQINQLQEKLAIKKMTIDGEPVEYPSLSEVRDNQLHTVYNANLQRRTTLRILVELGGRMKIGFRNGSVAEFSLLGSQKSLESAYANCRNH